MQESFENTDKVSGKILEDARQEVKKILEDARKNANEIIEAAREERENKLAEARSAASGIYKKVHELEIAKARAAMEQEMLMQKINIIDYILDKSVNELISHEHDNYEIFLKKNFKALNIKSGQYQIGEKEKFINDSIIKKIAGASHLQKSGKKADFDYGIKIIEDKKEYSISAETLMKTNVEDIRMELARFIFEKE